MPSYDNYQPSLALTEYMPLQGVFPPRGFGGYGTMLGFVHLFGGNFAPGGAATNGQIMQIFQNTALFSILGTTYGGDGRVTFALPDLQGRLTVDAGQGPGLTDRLLGETYGSSTFDVGQPNLTYHSGGNSTPVDNEQPTEALHYVIQVDGVYPSPDGGGGGLYNIGNIALFAGDFEPGAWMECAGQLLPIASYETLFSLIGTTYGGDGQTTFALPDLRDRTIIGAGQGPGLPAYTIGETVGQESITIGTGQTPTNMGGSGQPIDNRQPSLAMNYIIALQGIFPSRDGDGGGADESPFLGEIMATAVNFAPRGFALCAGQILPISQNQALFALLGTTYGGNGVTTFALPDLRGRSVMGVDTAHPIGSVSGENSVYLNSNLGQLVINDDDNGHTLYGGDANDLIMGNGGDDYMDGGHSADSMYGGIGNDTYVVDDAADLTIEKSGEGTDTVRSSVSFTLSANVENLVLTGGSIDGTGNELDNILTGSSGNNRLDGAAGADTMIGGLGDDTYVVDNGGDVIVENPGEGIDSVNSAISYTLSANVENLTLTGTGNTKANGNELGNILTGNSGNNKLDGKTGADTMAGGLGDDTYVVGSSADVVIENANEGTDTVNSTTSYTLGANVENLVLLSNTNINATGNDLDNILTGNSGNNKLDGKTGADTMAGGLGDDTYVVGTGHDVVIENVNEGTDTVNSTTNYTLSANVENLVLLSNTNISGTGNELDNILTGNSGNNSLDGGAGADTMIGGLGDDTYVVDNSGDMVTENASEGTDLVQSSVSFTLGANVENLTLTGSSNINGTGNELGNVITGNSGNNKLDGRNGADTMAGGLGDDTYVVGTGNDVVIEDTNSGIDTVNSTTNYTLGANVENLVLLSNTNISGTGNELDNILTGNSGNNSLDGGAGADSMYGGAGDDTYVVDNGGDVVTENASEGTDLVLSSVTYTMTANVENLILTGSSNINGTGNELGNVITGNSGNNKLDGKTGADTMAGGLGDDTYVVGTGNDVVIEDTNSGIDTINSTTNYTLSANVENLVLLSNTNISGTGNDLDNILTGNSGNNRLDGGAGADTMSGGLGDDTYVVDNTHDVVTENASEGTDLVLSSITYTMAANVENLTLMGTDSINGTGNELGNILTGNSGNNKLDGKTGADTMAGGLGDDTYVVGSSADVVIENANEGNDTIQSTATYTLGANVENLVLLSTTNINATGNDLDNMLTGNSGNNKLTGGAGNDTLAGGAGSDTFIFGHFGSGAGDNGLDHLTDFQSGVDYLSFKSSDYGGMTSGTLILNTDNAVGTDAQFVYDTASHTLYWDANGSTSGGQTAIVVFSNSAAPTTGDFIFT